jgi:hypothetical protein
VVAAGVGDEQWSGVVELGVCGWDNSPAPTLPSVSDEVRGVHLFMEPLTYHTVAILVTDGTGAKLARLSDRRARSEFSALGFGSVDHMGFEVREQVRKVAILVHGQ